MIDPVGAGGPAPLFQLMPAPSYINYVTRSETKDFLLLARQYPSSVAIIRILALALATKWSAALYCPAGIPIMISPKLLLLATESPEVQVPIHLERRRTSEQYGGQVQEQSLAALQQKKRSLIHHVMQCTNEINNPAGPQGKLPSW